MSENTILATVTYETPKQETKKQIKSFGRFGKEIKISPKSHCTLNEAGMNIKYHVPTVEVLIGIGKDHYATLIMDREAHLALTQGEEIHISTDREVKNKFGSDDK